MRTTLPKGIRVRPSCIAAKSGGTSAPNFVRLKSFGALGSVCDQGFDNRSAFEMLRSFATLSLCPGAFKSGGTTVISSSFSRRPFVPSLHFGTPAKHCSTKSTEVKQAAPEKAKEDGSKIDNWYTIYHFPSIMITASVKRLKYYPTIVTAVSVPVSIALAYANIWSMTTAEIVGAIGK